MQNDYLEHYGIKGMHWGIRRFQNADGSLTSEGKKRYGSGDGTSKEKKFIDGKKIAKGAVMAAGIAGAAYVYSRNRSAVNAFVKSNANKIVERAKVEITGFPPKVGKKAKAMAENFAKGAGEGLEQAPYKMAKAMVEGAAYIAGSYAIGKAIGSTRANDLIQSHNAYNKKNKVGRVTTMDEFMRGESRYDDSDDDED